MIIGNHVPYQNVHTLYCEICYRSSCWTAWQFLLVSRNGKSRNPAATKEGKKCKKNKTRY